MFIDERKGESSLIVKNFISSFSRRPCSQHFFSNIIHKVLKIQRWAKKIIVVRWFIYGSNSLRWNKFIREAPSEESSQLVDMHLRLSKMDSEKLSGIPGKVKLTYLRVYYKVRYAM